MIVLDVTIVNVALPGDPARPRRQQAGLTWIVDAFLITFGSLLLLAGRLGDLAGRKRVFLAGLVIFTFASLLCGIAASEATLIGARPLEGAGAATQASVILAIVVASPEPAGRARRWPPMCSSPVAGGSLGLPRGILTQAISWHWVFFVNLPIGVATFALAHKLIHTRTRDRLGREWIGWASCSCRPRWPARICAIVGATSPAGSRLRCSASAPSPPCS